MPDVPQTDMTGCYLDALDTLKCHVDPSDLGVRRVMQGLMSHLGRVCPDSDRRQRVEIAVAETLNNIVEHAFSGPISSGQSTRSILMTCKWTDNSIQIEVEDNGLPLPAGEIPDGAPVDLDVTRDDLPEGGFGWFLIRSLTSDLTYLRQNGQNRLTLWFT